MRRIIERVVTVVTTTTWKISWERDLHPSQPAEDPISDDISDLGALPEPVLPAPTVTETKEERLPEDENAPDPS